MPETPSYHLPRCHDRRAGRARARTLLDITICLIPVVILVLVLSARRYGIGPHTETAATFLKITAALEEYRSVMGHYPPDGIDSSVETRRGAKIRGSACLYHFLSQTTVPGTPTEDKTEQAVWWVRFLERELSPEDPALPGVREIVDAWGIPIHYDSTEDGVFKPQRGEVHLPPIPDDKHPPDPREGPLVPGGPVQKLGIQGKGFDLWSHGEQWVEWEEPVKPSIQKPIASWSLEKSM